jgi:hypothetical protein
LYCGSLPDWLYKLLLLFAVSLLAASLLLAAVSVFAAGLAVDSDSDSDVNAVDDILDNGVYCVVCVLLAVVAVTSLGLLLNN